MSTHLIYALIDPDTEAPRYIGKSTQGLARPRQHFSRWSLRANTHKNSWLKKVLAAGRTVEIQVIEEFPEDCGAERLSSAERFWIENYRWLGCDLTNATDGGEGTKGLVRTPEHRAKLAAAHKGKALSPEHKAKIGATSRGRTHSPETRARMSRSAKGRVHSPEAIAKMSAAKKGRAQKGHPMSPEARAKIAASLKGHLVPPEVRAKISAALMAKGA
jgi:hypothetical protein